MKKYDLIYSLGADCACATYLKINNLRLYSGPFDWLTHCKFSTRMKLILNNFEEFLNIEDLRPLEKDLSIHNDNNCDYYENIKNGIWFYHDFPCGVPLKQSYSVVKEKYNRRIKRFYKLINKKKNILLVWFAHNQITPDETIIQLCNNVMQKFEKSIDFLIIENNSGIESGVIQIRWLSEHIMICNLNSVSYDENGRITTLGNEYICNKVFQAICLRKSSYGVLKNFFIKFICLFLPSKSLRRIMKNL